jgi:hypothetical protein
MLALLMDFEEMAGTDSCMLPTAKANPPTPVPTSGIGSIPQVQPAMQDRPTLVKHTGGHGMSGCCCAELDKQATTGNGCKQSGNSTNGECSCFRSPCTTVCQPPYSMQASAVLSLAPNTCDNRVT